MKYCISNKIRAALAAVSLTVLSSGLALLGGARTAHAVPPNMHLVWQDKFTGASTSATPNPNVWAYDLGAGGWGNNEWQTYVNSWANCHVVSDGTGTDNQALRIRAERDSAGKYYSARIKTQGKVAFGPYGYYEARCKFPNAGKGYWPAFWTLGTNITSVGWPSCGEIDIAEEINGQWENHQSLHAPGWDPTSVRTVNQSTTTYHTYGVMWQPEYITFYVDGVATSTYTNGHNSAWVFNKQVFLILNLAVGGNWPGSPDGSTQVPADYYIDYVRVYQY